LNLAKRILFREHDIEQVRMMSFTLPIEKMKHVHKGEFSQPIFLVIDIEEFNNNLFGMSDIFCFAHG
jgi:hypothetical protein